MTLKYDICKFSRPWCLNDRLDLSNPTFSSDFGLKKITNKKFEKHVEYFFNPVYFPFHFCSTWPRLGYSQSRSLNSLSRPPYCHRVLHHTATVYCTILPPCTPLHKLNVITEPLPLSDNCIKYPADLLLL
jgi:hypothetical protein